LDLQLVNITSRAEPARYLNEPTRVESSRAEPARYPPLEEGSADEVAPRDSCPENVRRGGVRLSGGPEASAHAE
jgi:hypothetical protein